MVFSTQQAVNIAGIKDGVIVMKDGSYRLILQVAATNFALKSEEEQNSIVFQYQSFLNSLHFPIEIVISSRRLDLTPYIAKIEKTLETQKNDLLKAQTTDYIDFLRKLIDLANIMKKTFYVVVPYQPLTLKKPGFLDSMFGGKKSLFEHVKVSEKEFTNYTGKLREQANTVAMGLGSLGLHCFQLTTEQLIELFYLYFNPDEATKEVVKDATQLSSPVVMNENEFGNGSTSIVSKEVADVGTEQMIDNTGVVQARHKQEALDKKHEEGGELGGEPSATAADTQTAPTADAQTPAAPSPATPAQPMVPSPASPQTPPPPTTPPVIPNQSS